MPEATDTQVQTWSNERTRPGSETFRDLLLRAEDNNASIGSVYERLTGSGGWSDDRQDGPPNLLAGNDILAFNTVCVQFAAIMRHGGTAGSMTDQQRIDAVKQLADQLPIVFKACVRSVK